MFITLLTSSGVNVFTTPNVLEFNVKFAKIVNVIKHDALHFLLKFLTATTIRMIVKQHAFLVLSEFILFYYPPNIKNDKRGY